MTPSANLDTATAQVPAEPALLIDADEAAELLGVARATLYRLDAKGRIPRAVHLGRLRRWSRAELRRWVDAGCPSRSRWEAAR